MAATGLAPGAAAQPALAPDERGDLALAPYYTVRDEWVTGLHIVNTSARTQVVKVRFRRATDGMDALDFNIVMSPKDVYAGFTQRRSERRHCLGLAGHHVYSAGHLKGEILWRDEKNLKNHRLKYTCAQFYGVRCSKQIKLRIQDKVISLGVGLFIATVHGGETRLAGLGRGLLTEEVG